MWIGAAGSPYSLKFVWATEQKLKSNWGLRFSVQEFSMQQADA